MENYIEITGECRGNVILAEHEVISVSTIICLSLLWELVYFPRERYSLPE